MRYLRFVALAAAVFAVAGTAFAGAATRSPSTSPKHLRAFLLRVDEPVTHSYPRTPAFAWAPVRGARCYQFELGTSRRFTENSLIWSNVPYVTGAHTGCSTVPAISLDTALPWFTGTPYGLYAHVRAVTADGTTRWSAPFGFNVRWTSLPKPMASQPGLVRWTPVEGATRYQVWYQDTDTPMITTNTNVADEREYYTFHSDPTWTATVHWRVRAVRQLFGDIPNGLPAVSYGPWSPVYTSTNPPLNTGNVTLKGAVSDKVTTGSKGAAHELMPALTWNGSSIGGRQYALFRPYAFTDNDCVNVVFTGSVVGSPAFAPRLSGPLKLPGSDTDLTVAMTSFLPSATTEGGATFAADGSPVSATEGAAPAVATSASTSSSSATTTTNASDTTPAAPTTDASPRVDLPDLNFPTTKYFWTLVPVLLTEDASGTVHYVDAEVPQDACSAQRRASFGKESAPVTTASGTPFVAGLAPSGRLLSSAGKRPVVYGTPLIAWQPAMAASSYQVQWSKTLYPWRPAGAKLTSATSATLPLRPGAWYYRVRGLNAGALKIPFMSWSAPVRITVARPTFRLLLSK
jgi:hypothetical protein